MPPIVDLKITFNVFPSRTSKPGFDWHARTVHFFFLKKGGKKATTDDMKRLGNAGRLSRVKDTNWLAALIDLLVKERDSVSLDSALAYQRHVAD